MPNIITLPSGATFKPKQLKLRGFKELVLLIEAVKESKKQSDTLGLVEKALELAIESDVPIWDVVDWPDAMPLLNAVVSSGRVTDDERKKSE